MSREVTAPGARPAHQGVLRAADVQLYRVCDIASEFLIYFAVLFSPWAFGTTQPWSVWTMNAAGYALGLLLFAKLAIRKYKGYSPLRWTPACDEDGDKPVSWRGACLARVLIRTLAILTILIIGYCLVSAVNARATFLPAQLSFEYHDYVKWLPHSLHSTRTWQEFWNYLGLGCAFWGMRDWLSGMSPDDERRARTGKGRAGLPDRLRRLLWVVCLNGALVAAEGIAQRLEGSGRLLFIVKPRVNPGAETQFGPYAYRANASSFFNLIWPVCIGFWWTLNRSSGGLRHRHHWLLVCAILMAACPLISTSRAGAVISAGIMVLTTVFLVATHFTLRGTPGQGGKARITTLAAVVMVAAGTVGLGYWLGWKALKPRMAEFKEGYHLREEMYNTAKPMARDYPLFGTGPGTFDSVFQLYRFSTGTYWPAQLHNDWLETRITFGWAGMGMILLALLIVLTRWFARGGIYGGRRFTVLLWFALTGVLVHARWDFPFQIYSLVFLTLLWCAVLSVLSRSPGR